jgi:hypothetical protein
MSRGSQIIIGLFALAGAGLFFMTAQQFAHTPAGVVGAYGIAICFSVVATACLVKKGRHITMRITAGIVAFALGWGLIGTLRDGEVDFRSLVPAMIALAAGTYAATGRYPDELPLSVFFGGQSTTKKKKRKKSQQIRTPQPPPEL